MALTSLSWNRLEVQSHFVKKTPTLHWRVGNLLLVLGSDWDWWGWTGEDASVMTRRRLGWDAVAGKHPLENQRNSSRLGSAPLSSLLSLWHQARCPPCQVSQGVLSLTAEHKISRPDLQVRYPSGRATFEQSILMRQFHLQSAEICRSAQTIYTWHQKQMITRSWKLFDMSFVGKTVKGRKQVSILPDRERLNRSGETELFTYSISKAGFPRSKCRRVSTIQMTAPMANIVTG